MVMHSCITLSCTSEKRADPMRFAGTWKRYSKNASAQLAAIAIHSGACLTFKCPYHASVMKTFEMISKIAVIIFHFSRRACAERKIHVHARALGSFANAATAAVLRKSPRVADRPNRFRLLPTPG